MTRKQLIAFTFSLVLSIGLTFAEKPSHAGGGNGGGGGGGGGGGNNSSDPQAEFLFPVVDQSVAPIVTGDELVKVSTTSTFTSYKKTETDPGVEAYFMGSGNPTLELVKSDTRFLKLHFADRDISEDLDLSGNLIDDGLGTCSIDGTSLSGTLDADLESLIFSQLATEEDWRHLDYTTIDGRFLGMTEGDIGYSMMGIRFTHPLNGTDYDWSIVFGDHYDGNQDERRNRVVVECSSGTETDCAEWAVTGLEDPDGSETFGPWVSTAEVRLRSGKGKKAVELNTFCDFEVDFLIKLLP